MAATLVLCRPGCSGRANMGHFGKASLRPGEADPGVGWCQTLLGRLLMSLAVHSQNIGSPKSWGKQVNKKTTPDSNQVT